MAQHSIIIDCDPGQDDAIALLLAFAGGAYAFTRIRPGFAARTRIERIVMGALLAASLIAILTTIGIVASLVYEAARFFSIVPVTVVTLEGEDRNG